MALTESPDRLQFDAHRGEYVMLGLAMFGGGLFGIKVALDAAADPNLAGNPDVMIWAWAILIGLSIPFGLIRVRVIIDRAAGQVCKSSGPPGLRGERRTPLTAYDAVTWQGTGVILRRAGAGRDIGLDRLPELEARRALARRVAEFTGLPLVEPDRG